MRSYHNDYSEGAHPVVLDALVRTNMEQHVGYAEDEWCSKARALIRQTVAESDTKGALAAAGIDPEALEVRFVAGGTMANLLIMSAALRPHECVIASPDGHVNVHETGAIEANGHKVLTTADANGLLTVAGVDQVMKDHLYGTDCHMVKPRILYLSLATEIGLVPTAQDLADLRAYADQHNLLFYIDGARLACGLASDKCDATLADVCAAADAFSIGGTKNGLLFGEALVIRNPQIAHEFRYIMKQKGSFTAKGRLLGVQFHTLFSVTGKEAGIPEAVGEEAMYFSLGRHSVAMAKALQDVLVKHGFTQFASEAAGNQLFPVIDVKDEAFFVESFNPEIFGRPDDNHVTVRLTTSWATTMEHIAEADKLLAGYVNGAAL